MLEDLFCLNNKTLLDALHIINKNAKGAVFVIDDRKKLCGVLTDGDLRRLLLSGFGLQEKISNVLKKEVVYARNDESSEEMLAKMNEAIKILPIVNDNFQVIDYLEYKSNIHFPIVSPDLKGNELKYLIEAFLSTWISSRGEYIERFEKDFSAFCGCKHGIATSNGTTALHLGLLACGISPGDEVIVPDLTFAASINAVLHAGATPVIVDIEEDSWCIDVKEIKKVITKNTKVIMPVHLYGQPCDMDEILAVAKDNGLFVIEDCAEAHGALYDGKKVGALGDIGCFSFYGNKIITTGEGGMCVTNSEDFKNKMQILRDHGMSKDRKYWHEVVGYNYRMTNLQAAIGVAQLERIDEILLNRQNIEKEYRKQLRDIRCLEFQKDNLAKRKKITWLVSALLNNEDREKFLAQARVKKIDIRTFFYPLSYMDIYKPYVFSCSQSHRVSDRGVNFPTNEKMHGHVIQEIKDILLNL